MNKFNRQSGNVFLVVLLGIALFTVLAFVLSRGMRSESTTGISRRQAELSAVDILSYAQRLERAVAKLRNKGVSENDIDFGNAVVAGYDHGQPAANKIFDPAGGGMSWTKPEESANDGSDWLITGATCISGVGSGAAGCDASGPADEELLAVLPNLKLGVCEELNKRLNIAVMPSGGAASASKFTGTFADGDTPVGADGLTAACFTTGGNYFFYYVLLAR